MVCLVLPSATIYAISQMNHLPLDDDDNRKIPTDPNIGDLDDIEKIALDFLMSGPTFSFDGIPESIIILERYTMESYPEQHIVVISFNTTHAGWGNREGTFIAQVITSHSIRIKIVENKVNSAVIDGKWDELKQEQIIPEELRIPERARDAAILYVLENYSELEGLEFPSSMISEQHTPEGWVGSSTFRYLSEGWNVTVQYAVVLHPDLNINIEYTGSINFHWRGVVYNNGEVSATEFILH